MSIKEFTVYAAVCDACGYQEEYEDETAVAWPTPQAAIDHAVDWIERDGQLLCASCRTHENPVHARALELREKLLNLHAADNPALAEQTDAAEHAFTDYLIAHRDHLGDTDFWSGDYALIDHGE
ncbi:hypothetical protein [Nocardia sp. NPDC003726]